MKDTVLPRTQKDSLVIRELDDETLVYDIERDEAHCLNQTAALVWKHCDGKTTAREAVQSLQSTLGVPVEADIVWLAVKQLQRFHLVEGTSKKSPGVSRRALVLKYAPAALALPVIMSITAPAAFGAASCATNGQSCVTTPCCPGFSCFGSPLTCHPS
jgi:hypothetical protein